MIMKKEQINLAKYTQTVQEQEEGQRHCPEN